MYSYVDKNLRQPLYNMIAEELQSFDQLVLFRLDICWFDSAVTRLLERSLSIRKGFSWDDLLQILVMGSLLE